MSIADYSSLRSAVLSYAARSDSRFTAQFSNFLQLAEQRMYEGSGDPGDPTYTPALRTRAMEVSTDITITDGVGTWPDDVLEVRKIFRDGDTEGLSYMKPERLAVELERYPSGNPLYYTIEGSEIKIAPGGDETLTVSYYGEYDPITDTNTAGPLIVAHGLIYLELCLFEAFAWMQDQELAMGHLTKGRAMIEGANRRAQAGRTPGQMRSRPRRVIGA